MAYKQKPSPFKQTKTFQEYTKERFGNKKAEIAAQPMLSNSGETEYKLTKNGKDITNTKAGKHRSFSITPT